MFPKSPVGQVLAAIWLLCAAGLLVFAYVQQGIHDMPVALTSLLVLLAFPIGVVAVPVAGVAWSSLATNAGFVYHPFWHSLPLWVVAVSLGYLQWFVVVPKVFLRLSRASTGA
jgi:formate/nitrite transporter FocA (FNT family)